MKIVIPSSNCGTRTESQRPDALWKTYKGRKAAQKEYTPFRVCDTHVGHVHGSSDSMNAIFGGYAKLTGRGPQVRCVQNR